MPTHINCPSCGTSVDVEEVLSADAEQRIRQQYEQELQKNLASINNEKKRLEEEQKSFEEKKRRENELFQERLKAEKQKLETELNAEKRRIESELQQQLKQKISADYENQLRLLQQNAADNEAKLKDARKKELEFLQKEQALRNREQELEIAIQKKLLEERNILSQQIRKEEAERNQLKETEYTLKLKELEKQLEDQRKLAEEMKRKAEQGSMQLQGEVQELLLESLLREAFPTDVVHEVGKGVEGADCMLTVQNRLGQESGKIIFESKRTKAFHNGWIEKLKTDMRAQGADVAILVTAVFPKDMHCFGERDGVWICTFSEVIALTNALRHTILRVSEARKSEENKGDKMNLLYGYLTGVEFRQQIETIVEGFLSLKNNITKERIQMEKMWKEREKQLEKVLLSTSGMYGSIKGIAGASIGSIPLLDDGGDVGLLDE
ncbi:DUF2130 domain-containing protein [Flaviaesturariibacter flavus]|uniref:DUF2130 domain-containing protein n=1 Tax=Flaviaesturariibacter flavus TaxID=2502780 RepID=A0A4R1BNY1_9BACT|nr:DUF2130 domain-containing protein [Flaviaesturariibacter flavus]TCJ19350.1 DUF2130 domain-containing protein [Flaviaesturariibacter flavus]